MAVAFWKILITFPEPKQLSEVHLEATLRYVDPGAKTPFRGEQGSSVMPPNQKLHSTSPTVAALCFTSGDDLPRRLAPSGISPRTAEAPSGHSPRRE